MHNVIIIQAKTIYIFDPNDSVVIIQMIESEKFAIMKLRKYPRNNIMVSVSPWALRLLNNPTHFKLVVENNCLVYKPLWLGNDVKEELTDGADTR